MFDEDPEIIALTDRILTQVFAMAEANKAKLKDELLPLLGLMSIEFNLMEGDFKYLLIILRDDLPLINSLRIAAQGWPSFEHYARMKELIDRKLRDNGTRRYHVSVCTLL